MVVLAAATAGSSAAAATTTAGSSLPLLLRVVSYNVLSSHLAVPSHFCRTPPEHLEAERRLPKLLRKLELEMQEHEDDGGEDGEDDGTPSPSTSKQPRPQPRRHTVFCLQEVSYDWSGALHAFFARRGYHVVAAHYGRPFNGHMGVLTAYPTATDKNGADGGLETVAVDISRCSDTYAGEWPEPPAGPAAPSVFSQLWSKAASLLGWSSRQQQQQEDEDPWQLARRRSNVLVTVVVRDPASGWSCAVGNYHMPCAFYSPAAMTLHGDLCLAHVQRVAAAHSNDSSDNSSNSGTMIPYILAGDFNFKPGDPVYQLLTTGRIDADSPGFPPATVVPQPDGDGGTFSNNSDNDNNGERQQPHYVWKPTLREPVRSAYVAATGREPDFTNFALTGDMGGGDDAAPFVAPLDYIFVGSGSGSGNNDDNVEVESCKKLPHRDLANGPYPNADEPSDHVLIAANVRIGKQQREPQE